MSEWFAQYWFWLGLLSLVFVVLERLRPRDPLQRMLRPGLWSDLVYVVMNGHIWGVVIATLAPHIDISGQLASNLPWGVQLAVAFVVTDFMQWGIHDLLHRVPLLWRIHKVHHSIRVMDFWGDFRFHVGEIIVYKSLQYIPLALLGFDGTVLFALAIISTAIGYFTHANLNVPLGPFGYVFNGPQMHIWHHVHGAYGPINVNFGISLSVWDWLFGTAYLPEHNPEALGFDGVETYPANVVGQTVAPFDPRL